LVVNCYGKFYSLITLFSLFRMASKIPPVLSQRNVHATMCIVFITMHSLSSSCVCLHHHPFIKRKFKQWWSTIPPNVNKTNNHLSPSLTEHKKDHDIWRWKSSSWLGTCIRHSMLIHIAHSLKLLCNIEANFKGISF
jgi:hypothetical protein